MYLAPQSLPTHILPESLPTPTTQCGLHPMIILQQNSFVFKPKAFWMLLLNDDLYSKPCVFLWVANFRGLTASFKRLPILSRAFTVGHICITKNTMAFTRGGIYPFLLLPDTYFNFHVYNYATLLDGVPVSDVP